VLTAAGAIVGPSSTACGGGRCADQKRTDGTNFAYYTLDYDAATDESAYWQFVVPSSYTGTTVDVTLYWIANATTGSAVWGVATDSKVAGAAWDGALSAPGGGTAATAGTANVVNATTFTGLTSGWAVDEPAIFRVFRDADNAADDLAVDAKIIQVKIEWTASAESD
jgi:hypothetical protein